MACEFARLRGPTWRMLESSSSPSASTTAIVTRRRPRTVGAASFFTMSNSPLRGLRRAAHLVPAAHFLRPGCRIVFLCLHRISAAFAGASAGSRPSPWHQLQLRPRRNEGAGGAPGGALPVVALVGRDATLARRGASRANTGTPPLGAPPRRCRPRNRSGPGTICGIRPVGCSRPAIVMAGYGTGLFGHGLRAAIDATPRSACWIVSGDAPHERGWQIYTTSSHRSQ